MMHPFAAAREFSLLGRAATAFQKSWLEACTAGMAAQLVIAQRSAQLTAAAWGLRPLDHVELGRMSDEKVEAAWAAGPALATYWATSQARLLRLWQREATLAMASTARLASWNGAAMPHATTGEAVRAAARWRRAALTTAAAGTTAAAPVLAPYYDRVRANLERLSAPAAPASNKATRRRRAPRRRS